MSDAPPTPKALNLFVTPCITVSPFLSTPLATLLEKAGVHQDKFADSDGRIEELP